MSMSSGQVSALSLAFFLSLNKVYARVPLILIDDPSQSLDEVNVASLSDLLRCELKHCQLVVSSHEDNISAYMRDRFDNKSAQHAALGERSFVKAARGYLVELGVRDGHADELWPFWRDCSKQQWGQVLPFACISLSIPTGLPANDLSNKAIRPD
jgi:energy-coupling factor transporter ATP-binding protein EcfA2